MASLTSAVLTRDAGQRFYTVIPVFVSDLRHFLDMPEAAPGPARRMAEHLTLVVRAATAGEGGQSWVTALPCRRRPGRRPCTGNLAVFRSDVPPSIEWRCTACGDEGVISGWERSPSICDPACSRSCLRRPFTQPSRPRWPPRSGNSYCSIPPVSGSYSEHATPTRATSWPATRRSLRAARSPRGGGEPRDRPSPSETARPGLRVAERLPAAVVVARRPKAGCGASWAGDG